ncbi:hypothetical protein FIT74_04220 [Candidatus Methylopumilus universalis]|uniref:Oligosaccharide repeat unit polymerase n=1 Tax=Candidatus Methylopumilus universalis TaxID=2588536 RepID=A0ABX5VU39_9PROT|nr:hypothetical protein [Candidatus Methylopumilus universalis]QDC61369.1 hypothetical protein FIT74_04220 [Candidatus Methylopumilus universalis]
MPRFFQFLLAPKTVLILYATERYYFEGVRFNGNFLAKGLLLNLLGMLGFLLGLLLLSRFKKSPSKLITYNITNYALFSSIILGIIIVFILRNDVFLIYFYQHMNLSALIQPQKFVSLIQVLFNFESFMAISIAILLHQTNFLKKQPWKLYLISLIYITFKIYSGSRSGGLIILFFLSIGLFFYQKIYLDNLRRYLVFVLVIGFLSFLTFNFATSKRINSETILNDWTSLIHLGQNQTSSLGQNQTSSLGQNQTSSLGQNQTSSLGQNQTSSMDRLGSYFDAMNVVASVNGRDDLKNKFLNLPYYVFSFVNIVLPGSYFPCCIINTSFLPFFIFGSRDTALLENPNYYESGLYTLFGLEYLEFGFLGVFFFSALLIMIVDFLARVIAKFDLGRIFLISYIYSVLLMLLMMQGIDAYFVDIVKFTLSSFMAFILIYSISFLIRSTCLYTMAFKKLAKLL